MEMTIFQTILLGLVQGVTEFIPVSSSGHLMVVPNLFGFEEPSISYSAALHMGTLGAVLIYFWRDWLNILGLKRDMEIYQCNLCLLRYLFFGTLPIIIVGYLVNGSDDALSQNALVVALMIFVGGTILWIADRFFSSKRSMKDINMKDALIVGFFQIIALVPGVSRSGITMAAARVLKINRVDAARFSFLMGTPVILGAGVLSAREFQVDELSLAFWLGILASFVSGVITIHFLLAFNLSPIIVLNLNIVFSDKDLL